MALKPIACTQSNCSAPPTTTMSYSPDRISRVASMVETALLAHAADRS